MNKGGALDVKKGAYMKVQKSAIPTTVASVGTTVVGLLFIRQRWILLHHELLSASDIDTGG